MRWVVAVALAGCFGKPGFAHRDAPTVEDDARDARDATDATDTGACVPTKPSAPGLTYNLDPSNTTATMLDSSVIGFGNAFNNYPMVDRLIVNNQDLVATAEQNCGYEDRVGIAVYPIFNIGPEPAGSATHGLDIDRSGPALTLLRTQWGYPMPSGCGANAVGVGNTSWALFPDGRIVRNDTITPSDNGSLMPGAGNCNCSSATGVTNFIVTSYTTFETTRLFGVTDSEATVDATAVPTTPQPGARGACARGTSGGAVAVWWDRLDNNEPNPRPTRLRRATNPIPAPGHDIFAFVYDIIPATPPVMTIAQDDSFGIRTHMLLSQGGRPCTDMLAHVNSFAGIQPITIRPMTGSAMTVPYNAYGVFEDTRVFAEPVGISGTLPPGFAVHVRFPGFTAISTDRAAARVIWQRESDGAFYVFFRDGLSAGTPITITPECGS